MTPAQMRRAAELLMHEACMRFVTGEPPEDYSTLAASLRAHADEIEQRGNFAKQEKD